MAAAPGQTGGWSLSTSVAALHTHRLFLILLAARFAVPLALWGSIAAGVHDNLDSEVVYSAVIGRFWAGGADPAAFSVFLGGTLGWADFARTLHPLGLLYAAFPPVWAYALTEAVLLVLAYAGFRLLLRALGLQGGAVLACLAAFGLSYSSYGAGLAGAPLLLALLFRAAPLRGWAWGGVGLLGLNSAFALHGLFLPVAALALAAMTGRWPQAGRVAGVLGLYLAASLAASAGLVVSVLSGVPSHRADWVPVLPATPLADWATGTLANLLTLGSAYHAIITPALHVPVILLAALWAGPRRAAGVLAGVVALAIAVQVAEPLAARHLGALGSIQWHRFLLFVPLLVLVLAAMAPQGRMLRAALGLSLGLAVVAGFGIGPSALKAAVPRDQVAAIRATLKAEGRMAALQQAGAALAAVRPADLARGVETWAGHTRPAAYACLRQAWAGDGGGRVISHGPDPMLAPLHGIPALDGYHNYYPLAWKRAFRPVIAPRLAADPALADYFDGWGSRIGTLADRGAPGIAPDWAEAAALGATHVIADRDLALGAVATCEDLRLYRIAP